MSENNINGDLSETYYAKLRKAGKDTGRKTFSIKVPLDIVRRHDLKQKDSLKVTLNK